MVLDCLEKFLYVNCLWVVFALKMDKELCQCEGPRLEVVVAGTKDIGQLSLGLRVEELAVRREGS